MKGIHFAEENRVLNKPENMTDEECTSLPVFTDGKHCISCWELTEEELEAITTTKKVWLGILSGYTQPPVFLTVHNPFDLTEINTDDLKVFAYGDSEWYIGRSLEEVEAYIKHELGPNDFEYEHFEIVEMDNEALESLRYEDTEREIKMSFKEGIKYHVMNKLPIPWLFATTEI